MPEAGGTFTDSGRPALPRHQPAADGHHQAERARATSPRPPGTGQVTLNWQASTDNVGVTGYRVFRGTGTQINTRHSGRRPPTRTRPRPGPYSYTVKAVDAAGNLSDPSNTASATVPDTTKPIAPGTLTATAGTAQVALSWQAATRQRGRHRLPRLPRARHDPIATLGVDDLLHRHRPRARPLQLHGEGRRRGRQPLRPEQQRERDRARHDQADSRPAPSPRPPAPRQVTLSWQASTDNVGVTGYRVFRGTGTTQSRPSAATTTYTDTEPRPRALQLHGEGRRRRRQPLRPEQQRERDRARHDQADRAAATSPRTPAGRSRST